MSFLAPYTNAMRLGQGFNSYTQEICIENAVLIEPPRRRSNSFDRRARNSVPSINVHQRSVSANSTTLRPRDSNDSLRSLSSAPEHDDLHDSASTKALIDLKERPHPLDTAITSVRPAHKNIVQVVTYSSRMVDSVSEIVEALNISSSASIKYGTVKGAGSASIVNENKVNQSDLNYIVTVKVTNETSPVADKMTFNPIPELNNNKFTDVFGDCFISGFTEGGEFSAIISINVSDKSKVSAVKAAAEAEIAIAAAPGLSVGTSQSMDKHKSDVWDDTETTISVNWAGGGDIKPPEKTWDLATVVAVATRFPHLVETCAQRTSAILTRYTSLRSFNEANTRNEPHDRFKILDYDLCSLYTQDLFSAFLAYKNIWADLTDMMKHPERYSERDESTDLADPIHLTPGGLNEARLLSRKGMTQITDVTKALITDPSLADLDDNGKQRVVPYKWPEELSKRMPIKHRGLTIREQADLSRRSTNYKILTQQEIGKIGTWARDDALEFAPLVGDQPRERSHMSWFSGSSKSKNTLFNTLDDTTLPNSTQQQQQHSVLPLTKLRLHAHENTSVNWLAWCGRQTRSKRFHGAICGIGYSTASSTTAADLPKTGFGLAANGPRHDDMNVLGNAAPNPRFQSHPEGDFVTGGSMARAEKVIIGYVPGEGYIASMELLNGDGVVVTAWRREDVCAATEAEAKSGGMKRVEQEIPNAKGWVLVGFWGHFDGVGGTKGVRVLRRLGCVWGRV